jgi:hypothetical protein
LDQDLRSMDRSICDAALVAYLVLPLENDPTTDGNSHTSLILYFHSKMI